MAIPYEYKSRVSIFSYGKCEHSPYVDDELWFVHVPGSVIGATPSITYIVPEKFANNSTIDEYYKDKEKWEAISIYVIEGSDWNPKKECLWRDMPYWTHILKDGTPIRYGLSRTQPQKGDCELWYVTIGAPESENVHWGENKYDSFVVEKICTTEKCLDLIGADLDKWTLVSWEHPAGIEPWYASIEDELRPDPLMIFSEKERKQIILEQ